MILLHKKSILDCSELDETIHQAETEKFLETILSLPNFDCDINVIFEDDYHKKMNYPLFYESNLHRISDFIASQDIKNGIDIFLTDDNYLAFRTFGQGYTINDYSDYLTTLIAVKCYGEGMSPIDMSRFFNRPSQELDKELSV